MCEFVAFLLQTGLVFALSQLQIWHLQQRIAAITGQQPECGCLFFKRKEKVLKEAFFLSFFVVVVVCAHSRSRCFLLYRCGPGWDVLEEGRGD